MKRNVLIIVVAGLISMNSTAQNTFKKGTKLLEAAISFNDNGKPLAVSYEVGLKDNVFGVQKLNFGLGAYFGMYGYSSTANNFGGTSTSKFTIIAPGIRGLLHYQLINKLDAYFGPSVGMSFQKGSTEATGMETKTENKLDFAWGFIGGLRYEITPKWGAFIEGGKASGNFTLGAAYKF